MKVRELIERLRAMNGDAEIVVFDEDFDYPAVTQIETLKLIRRGGTNFYRPTVESEMAAMDGVLLDFDHSI